MGSLVDYSSWFDKADTAFGAAGSTTGAGNGWIDVAGSNHKIVGGKLYSVGGSGFGTRLRPPSGALRSLTNVDWVVLYEREIQVQSGNTFHGVLKVRQASDDSSYFEAIPAIQDNQGGGSFRKDGFLKFDGVPRCMIPDAGRLLFRFKTWNSDPSTARRFVDIWQPFDPGHGISYGNGEPGAQDATEANLLIPGEISWEPEDAGNVIIAWWVRDLDAVASLRVTNLDQLEVTASASVTVLLTGVGTTWNSVAPTFSVTSTGTGCSKTSQTILSDTTASVTISTGTAGTITITDSTTSEVEKIITFARTTANGVLVINSDSTATQGIGGYPNNAKSFAQRLVEKLDNWILINRSIPGTNWSNWATLQTAYVDNYLTAALAHGIGAIAVGYLALNQLTDTTGGSASATKAQTWADGRKTANPDAIVVTSCCTARGDAPQGDSVFETDRLEYNSLVLAMVPAHFDAVLNVDTQTDTANKIGGATAWSSHSSYFNFGVDSSDKVHYSDLGSEQMALGLYATISPFLTSPVTIFSRRRAGSSRTGTRTPIYG